MYPVGTLLHTVGFLHLRYKAHMGYKFGSLANGNAYRQDEKNFVDKGIPVIIGEYAASGSDLSSCIFFIEKLNKLCSDYGIATFIWDSGSQVNRKTYKWRTPQYLEALKRATSGKDYEVVKE